MSVSEAASGVVDESVNSTELAPGGDGFHLQPRCRICRNDQVRTKVNDLLATGASYAMVLRALGDDNATLQQRDRVTIDSIRNHANRHFPVQNAARATYREILERRAKQNSVDFIEGVATAITPLAVLETIMVKGYQTLIDEHTTVSYRDAMEAALKLNEISARTRAPRTAPACWPRWAASSRWCGPSSPPNGGPTYRRPCAAKPLYPHRHRSRSTRCAWWPSTTRTRTATDGH